MTLSLFIMQILESYIIHLNKNTIKNYLIAPGADIGGLVPPKIEHLKF